MADIGKNNQNKLGSSTEEEIAEWFKAHQFVAFVVPKSRNGQPFDIIAVKQVSDEKVIFFGVDAKHLELSKKSFTFDRIEPNQKTSMRFARLLGGIKNLGFVIKSEIDPSRLLFLPYDRFVEEEINGAKSVKLESLEDMEEVLCKLL